MGTISKNFSYSEFERSDIADRYVITNGIRTVEVRDAIYNLVTKLLQPLRDAWKEPLHINSGYRCPEVNKLAGGVETSQHVKGEAADVGCGNPLELARLVIALGLEFDQMILYSTFLHLSLKLNGKQRMQILYNKSYRGDTL